MVNNLISFIFKKLSVVVGFELMVKGQTATPLQFFGTYTLQEKEENELSKQ